MTKQLASDYPVDLICQVLDYPRSSYYSHAHPRDDRAVWAGILRVAQDWPTYGYRRTTAQVSRE